MFASSFLSPNLKKNKNACGWNVLKFQWKVPLGNNGHLPDNLTNCVDDHGIFIRNINYALLFKPCNVWSTPYLPALRWSIPAFLWLLSILKSEWWWWRWIFGDCHYCLPVVYCHFEMKVLHSFFFFFFESVRNFNYYSYRVSYFYISSQYTELYRSSVQSWKKNP